MFQAIIVVIVNQSERSYDLDVDSDYFFGIVNLVLVVMKVYKYILWMYCYILARLFLLTPFDISLAIKKY